MVCKSPVYIYNPNWLRTSSQSDDDKWILVPCGRCIACRVQRTREWTERILSESFSHRSSAFVTFTYEDKNLPYSLSGRQTLVKKHLQDYFKRLRSDIEYNKKEKEIKIKYYAVGEYGENFFRPHYHAIIFGLDPCSKEDCDFMESNWHFGFVKIGSVTYESCQYVAGYVQKKLYGIRADEYEDSQPPFSIMSKNLGKAFVLENADVFSVGGSVPVGRNRRIHRSRYSDKVLELTSDEKYALSLSDEKSYWEDKVQPFYVEHEDGFVEFVSDDEQVKDLKRLARIQYNRDLDRRFGMRSKKL